MLDSAFPLLEPIKLFPWRVVLQLLASRISAVGIMKVLKARDGISFARLETLARPRRNRTRNSRAAREPGIKTAYVWDC